MRITTLLQARAKLFIVNKLSRFKKRLLGRNAEALLIKSDAGLFLVGVEDHNVANRLSYKGEYGRLEMERLSFHLALADDLLVVGGHIGTIAIPMSKHCRSVTAIEANPRTFQLLQLNVLINGCDNVRLINIAASNREEKLQFVMSKVNSGGSKRMPLVRNGLYFFDSPDITEVKAGRLDDILEGATFGVVFMDIEGSEYFALQGMQRILAGAKALFVEFIPHHLKNVSGATVDLFVKVLEPHFATMLVPSKNIQVSRSDFRPVLQSMYDRDESDDGIVFTK